MESNKWYAFKWNCELHRYSDSNIIRGSYRETCAREIKRKVLDKDNIRCHWSCCPKLKNIPK